jgi:hypothetical protein
MRPTNHCILTYIYLEKRDVGKSVRHLPRDLKGRELSLPFTIHTLYGRKRTWILYFTTKGVRDALQDVER